MRSPGRPKASAGDSAEQILRAATLLFAEHGLHGASTREIAAAAGMNIATVSYHFGAKADLYRAVFQRLAAQESALLAEFLARADDATLADRGRLRALLGELIDALVGMTLEQPETARLWVRRWLERPAEAASIEAEAALPVYEPVRGLLERARAAGTVSADLDTALFLQGVSWMLYGYFVGGPLDWQHARADPGDPRRLAALRAFLHEYTCRMLGL